MSDEGLSISDATLIARLRMVTGFIRFETGDRVAASICLSEEAADRIEQLQEELASGSFYKESDIDALQDRIKRLEAALQEIATDEHPLGWIAIAALKGN